ncbi:4-hydroxythreonine-4-phosphate dehydrogenase PdxA [Candidatus Endolissoclinum faulkneri]|uniref:4-hydroxythreonine-4-phosphate dehydrogenase PdxA n=1 Tax=Candidatus Endolissoclinum faulkneri TaxID=1263979 RepID=UPI00046CD420|nr:4-hydroxythreonine-4-phosphate dehydrogenase PdxA [Candidatus Endolissoclinum faulkneri]
MSNTLPPIALTPGEPAGIGIDLVLGLWAARNQETPAFFLIDDPQRVAERAHLLGLSIPFEIMEDPSHASNAFSKALPVLRHDFPAYTTPGIPNVANTLATLEAINRAVTLIRTGMASAVVTNPIQKETLYQAGFKQPGHTEYLATLSDINLTPVMLIAAPDLKVVPVTIHIPLAEVSRQLTVEKIFTTAMITYNALRTDFGIIFPRLALTGLNPHAGENGMLGREDNEVIATAVAKLTAKGIDACGPLPADTLFYEEARRNYDVVLGMYHDQVLVPIKTINFWKGVNVTIGLPFIRTSPNHGTALRLAGTGTARIDSLRAATDMAWSIAHRRVKSSDGR